MSDDEQNASGFPLGTWFGYYAGGLLAFILSVWIGNLTHATGIPIVTYLMVGFTLNRLILRQLSWNPLYNTISGVAKAKIGALIFWPLSYLILLFQVAVNKIL